MLHVNCSGCNSVIKSATKYQLVRRERRATVRARAARNDTSTLLRKNLHYLNVIFLLIQPVKQNNHNDKPETSLTQLCF